MKQAALVTGAAKRLGRHIALDLAAHGYDIVLHYHQSEAEALSVGQEIIALGVRCELISADLSDTKNYTPLIDKALALFPDLSVLVNNASVFNRAFFMESNQELYRKEFAINFEAPVFLTQAFAKRVGQGVVINMLDSRINRDTNSHFFYLLSKKNLHEFTRMAAAELGPKIRVNGVCPGFILPAEGFGEDYKQALEKRLPLSKTAPPQDVAQAVRLLIENTSLTGQMLFVDGGGIVAVIITIKNLRANTLLGVYDEERLAVREVLITLTLTYDASKAIASDKISQALDYAAIEQKVIDSLAAQRFALLETLAEHVARLLLEFAPLQEATVEISKPGAMKYAESVLVTHTVRR